MEKKVKLLEFLSSHYGYIETKELEEIGFNRNEINDLLNENKIRKVAYGLYIDNNLLEDELYIYQKKYDSLVYSFNTAFFILGLSERTPAVYDITVPRGKRIRDEYGFKVHQVVDEKYKIGIIEILSPCGNPIKIYNVERSICDIIKYPEEIETELATKIINNCFKEKKVDIDLLLDYAEKFNIYSEINTLVGVMIR